MELIVHLPSGALLASRTSKTPLASLDVTQRNELACRVWFVQDGPDVSQPLVPATIPAPYTRIVLSARPNDDLDDPTLVFFLADFSVAGEGDATHYTGTLNTVTEAAGALFATPTRRRHACYLDLDLLVTADPEDGRWTVVKQREFFLYRAIWQGNEGVDPDAVPAYPPPGEIVTEAPEDGMLYGRKDGEWEAVPEGGGGSGDLTPYLLREESFNAVAGKAYACDTSGTVEVPAVMPAFTAGGLAFTGTAWNQATSIAVQSDGSLYIGNNDTDNLYIGFEDGVTTLQDIVNFMASEGGPTTVALAHGANGTDLASFGSGTLSGGAAATEEFVPFEVTLPVPVVEGDERVVVAFCDARGTWGDNPIVVLRNGAKIEGVEANFINNAAGTFFAMVYIDDTTGWRVLASGTKPLNLSVPVITGTYSLTSSNGTWTGSPTSYAYQWQISDDGETGWANIEGATASSYTPIEADETKYVRCGVIATNANGPSVVAYSAATGPIDIPDFPMSGLLAFWKLADLTDASGNGNTLTNNNSVTFGAGKIGNAAVFDGTNWLTVAVNLNFSTTPYTFSMWAKRSAGGLMTVLGKAFGFNISTTGSGGVFADNFSSPSDLTANGVLTFDEWAHIVVVSDVGTGALYVNGVEVASGLTNFTNVSEVVLGSGNPYDPITGQIDAVGIWSRVLTEPEIAQLYNAGGGLEPS